MDADGIIRARHPLDYEHRRSYQIKVRVLSDSGREDTALVNIYVKDMNDHKPVLKDFYIFLNALDGVYDPMFTVPAEDPDVTSELTYSILSGNEHDFVSLKEDSGELYLKRSIINTAAEIKIKFEVTDGKYSDTAFGHILVSEVSELMVNNSMFIVLNKVSRNDFLKTSVLGRFKEALAEIFQCGRCKIYILSIEAFTDPRKRQNDQDMLEIAIAVQEESEKAYMTAKALKDLFYFNATAFERAIGFELVSFDFWNEYFCGSESCQNLKQCDIGWTASDKKRVPPENEHVPKYVVFRGIFFKPAHSCTCPHKYHGIKCDHEFNMCYSDRCSGTNGKCVPKDFGYTCVCNEGFTGTLIKFNFFFNIRSGQNPRKSSP